MFYHGGMLCQAVDVWYRRTTTTVQHGLGERSFVSATTGELVTGPETLTDEELAANRADYGADVRSHPLDDGFHRERSAVFDRITVPFLSAGNWGGAGRHLRGNVEGFVRSASRQKWLEIHGREHWTEFYTDYGISLQKRFLDHFLKDIDNGWDKQPPVMLRIRTVDGDFIDRTENEWPIARTDWTTWHLDPAAGTLSLDPPSEPAQASFAALDDPGITMTTPPMTADTEITGPVAATLYVSSTTTDADIFAVLRVFDPDGNEVVLQGAVDPHTPIGQGWLRASHRELDPALSTTVAAVAHPHQPPTADAPRRLQTRRRDLADVDHRARRLPHRSDHPRHRLRIRRPRSPIEPLQGLATARRRHLHPRRPDPAPDRHLRRHHHPAHRTPTTRHPAAPAHPVATCRHCLGKSPLPQLFRCRIESPLS